MSRSKPKTPVTDDDMHTDDTHDFNLDDLPGDIRPDPPDTHDWDTDGPPTPLLEDDKPARNREIAVRGISTEGDDFLGLREMIAGDKMRVALFVTMIGQQTARMIEQRAEKHSYELIGSWHGVSGEAVRKRIAAAYEKIRQASALANRMTSDYSTNEHDTQD